jgi:deoxyribonuclease-4
MGKPDYLLGSAREAISYGANCFMIYTGAPQNSIRTSLEYLHVAEFQTYLKENKIDINDVIVHAPYIANLGTSDASKHHIAVSVLKTEVYRTNAIGCKYLVLHPGSATNTTRPIAIQQIIKGINEINKINKNVVICLETMSGKGNEIGINFEELHTIIKSLDHQNNIGVCLDTCHISDSGIDPKNVDGILKHFDETIGLSFLKVIHLNDSKNQIDSHKDRHENIGYGTIGFETLCK